MPISPLDQGAQLQASRKAARARYVAIAAAMKAEAGITKHHVFKQIGGLAWSGTGRILAPQGVTRRQLYVLAHECGHNVLHGSPTGRAKPAHVKEHEAETYAHRAFARYGLAVPDKSAKWSRAYVGLWIMKDQASGVAICPMAAEWAVGRRGPHDPLPSVDGQPPNDFSKSMERFTAKAIKVADADDALARSQTGVIVRDMLPNSCATCWFYAPDTSLTDWTWGNCKAFSRSCAKTRNAVDGCNGGASWRPNPKLLKEYSYQNHRGFWGRLGDALIDRLSGRYRMRDAPDDQVGIAKKVAKIENRLKVG
jgi:hypothetical protein